MSDSRLQLPPSVPTLHPCRHFHSPLSHNLNPAVLPSGLPQTLPGRLKFQDLGSLICYLLIQWECPWVPGDYSVCVPPLGLLSLGLCLLWSLPCHRGHLAASGYKRSFCSTFYLTKGAHSRAGGWRRYPVHVHTSQHMPTVCWHVQPLSVGPGHL